MHNIHLMISAIGIIASALMVAVYFWARGRLTYLSWSNSTGLGFLLGFAAIGVICIDKTLFSIVIAGYILYFIYLKDRAEFNQKTEQIMLSLFSGVIIGLSGLIGFVLCAWEYS